MKVQDYLSYIFLALIVLFIFVIILFARTSNNRIVDNDITPTGAGPLVVTSTVNFFPESFRGSCLLYWTNSSDWAVTSWFIDDYGIHHSLIASDKTVGCGVSPMNGYNHPSIQVNAPGSLTSHWKLQGTKPLYF